MTTEEIMKGYFDKDEFEIKYINYTTTTTSGGMKGEQLIAMDSDIL